MFNKHFYYLLFTILFCGLLPRTAWAKPEYTGSYMLRGEAIGTVLRHNGQVTVKSEVTRFDVRDWHPSNYNPRLTAELIYHVQQLEGGNASLYTLVAANQPVVSMNDKMLSPRVTKIPLENSFYLNSFRGVDGRNNPFGNVVGQDALQGYVVHNLQFDSEVNTLQVEQEFDVHLDSSHFVNHYGLFVLNPQWQSSQQGLLKTWEYAIEIFIPRSWSILSDRVIERNGDVATIRLMPSEATFSCMLVPPNNNRLYKLVKTSLWLVLGISSLLCSGVAYGIGQAVMRYPIAPRIGILLTVVIGMAMNWAVAEALASYLLVEGEIHHLSLRTMDQIRYQNWQHNFYGALLSGLIGCLVFLRTLNIPFFTETIVEAPEPVEEEEPDREQEEPESTEPEKPEEVKYFTMTVNDEAELENEVEG